MADYFLDDNWNDWDDWDDWYWEDIKPKPLAINWAGQNILQMIREEYKRTKVEKVESDIEDEKIIVGREYTIYEDDFGYVWRKGEPNE